MPALWTKAALLADLPEIGTRIVEVGPLKIVLARAGGTLWAVEDRCSHDDGPLGEGQMDGFEIQCPRHGARFDVRTGEVTRMPAAVPVRAFRVKVEGDAVLVDLGEGS